jgi:transposase
VRHSTKDPSHGLEPSQSIGITAKRLTQGAFSQTAPYPRVDVRGRRSRHVLKATFDVAFAIDEDASIDRNSNLGKAARYVINQREPLTAMLREGRLPIHNNDTERDLRHAAVGRKNWSIFGSQFGGEVAARIFSLVISCKLAEIPPDAYFEDVLQRISSTPMDRIAELTPWGWKAQRDAEQPAAAGAAV